MNSIQVTTYNGFSNVSGETTLLQDIVDIRTGRYAALVGKISDLAGQGMTENANRLKKKLPFHTVTANYAEKRRAYSITRYNPVIVLDLDELETDRLPMLRAAINGDANTLGSFLSPKQHGFKIFVCMQTEESCRLRARLMGGEMTCAELEALHLKLYNAAKGHYERLLGVQIDGSGKDLSRGYFLSADSGAFLNEELMKRMEPLAVRIVPDEKCGRKPEAEKPAAAAGEEAAPLPPSSPVSVEPWERLLFLKAVTSVKRVMRFKKGNRNNFLFALGNKCYTKMLGEAVVVELARREFGQDGFDVQEPLHNAYTYTDKTTEAAVRKEEKKQPLIEQVTGFLEEHYGIRRNVILDRLEFMPCHRTGAAPDAYRPLRGKDYNSIFVALQLAGISCYQNYLKAVVDSNYAKDFNPFTDYLDNLAPWDGIDHIGRLADTVEVEERELWHEGFRRWIVGMVACALRDEDMNQLVPILYSEQGKGKSSWIRHLLPPQWKEYFYNGMVDPANKDHAQLLSTQLIINMEEFEGVKPGELANLKRFITQENITQRKVWDAQAFTFTRHASFIGSTNSRQCLQDIGGNRRFLPVTVNKVDYRTPVDHAGVYAQALALLDGGFRYWYEGEEIDRLNEHNELHRMKDPVEENLFVYFRRSLPEDRNIKWMPAASILTKLSVFGKVLVNQHAQQVLVQTLEKSGFGMRRNNHGTTEYQVVDLQQDEVEKSYKG